MPVVEDALWKNPGIPGMIVVPGHASVGPDQRLFLGYGEAKEAVRRIPEIEYQCAQAVQNYSVDGVYGFVPVRPSIAEAKVVGFGLFQTHYAWNESADLDLIRCSMERLREYAYSNANLKIRMSFPGLDSGLDSEAVSSLLLPLPPTVTICHKGELPRSVPIHFPGFKTLYLQVELLLQEGRYNQAVEYLALNGFDIQSAHEQVSAVQRILQSRIERPY
jgi:hypothetical protein